MPLTPGDRLGHYDVTALIGEGGMGQVYRATDTQLGRDVALKILPDAFAADPDRLARFQREAQVLASLNHPGIAAIYGIEKSDDTQALVLELVEGPTLADRIAKGPIPLEEALPIARQIAAALEAAHEAGVIHRDLKPANIKVREDGTVKVLDFGLAKALDTTPEGDPSQSPTLTAAATQMGVIMGTAAYMSPEQARGKPVDRRSDIWTYGCVLYEMLTGGAAFRAGTVSDTIAGILDRQPDWNALPVAMPASIRTLVRRCLAKDRTDRLQHIGDARVELLEVGSTTASEPGVLLDARSRPVWRQAAPLALGALVVGSIVTGVAVWTQTRPAPRSITRFPVVLPQAQLLHNVGRRSLAISPTGTHLAYVANGQIYLRAMDQLEAVPIPGTQDANPAGPFFSPDGQWLGFYSWEDSELQKIALTGGAAVTLADAGDPYGATWGSDDTIVFVQGPVSTVSRTRDRVSDGIFQVPGDGGTPELLVRMDSDHGERAHGPQLLQDGTAVLFTLASDADWNNAQVVVQVLETGDRRVVIDGGTDARYVPTGHLVYAHDGTLLAVPFDIDRLDVTGGPVALVEGVAHAAATGAANFDISRDGSLVYLRGDETDAVVRTLHWVDRDGTVEALAVPPRLYRYPRLSPDGTRVVVNARDEDNDLWIWDLARETPTRLTFAAEIDSFPVWMPDGKRVVFASSRDGSSPNLYSRAADGTGAVERLTDSPNTQHPKTISPDGTHLIFEEGSPDTGSDFHVLTLDHDRRVAPLIVTEFDEQNPEISPDGRWLAYESDASGQYEIWVRPFPDVDGGQWQISTTGGTQPLWGPDGRELLYLAKAGLMGVTVETEASFAWGAPTLIIEGPYYDTSAANGSRSYDSAPDGQRFLMLAARAPADPDDPFAGLAQIIVVENWFEELKARVPIN